MLPGYPAREGLGAGTSCAPIRPARRRPAWRAPEGEESRSRCPAGSAPCGRPGRSPRRSGPGLGFNAQGGGGGGDCRLEPRPVGRTDRRSMPGPQWSGPGICPLDRPWSASGAFGAQRLVQLSHEQLEVLRYHPQGPQEATVIGQEEAEVRVFVPGRTPELDQDLHHAAVERLGPRDGPGSSSPTRWGSSSATASGTACGPRSSRGRRSRSGPPIATPEALGPRQV
jgi:hypothetical protein